LRFKFCDKNFSIVFREKLGMCRGVALHSLLPKWGIRVDIAMSALTSAIHRTLPRPTETCLVAAFLRPFCKQWAQPPAAPASGAARFDDT
jgi:hypothetical protein